MAALAGTALAAGTAAALGLATAMVRPDTATIPTTDSPQITQVIVPGGPTQDTPITPSMPGTVTAIPEPGTLILLGSGVVAAVIARRRREQQAGSKTGR